MRSGSSLAAIASLMILASPVPCAADAAIMLGRPGTASTASAYGYEVNMTSGADAETVARRYCDDRGLDCRPHVIFGGYCFVLFDAKFADGRGSVLINPRPVPRELLFDLDRGQIPRQRLENIVLQPRLQSLLDELEREQSAKCVSSGGRCTLKARNCDVTTRGARGAWSESRQPQQPGQSSGPASSQPVRSKECQRYPDLCP